MHLLGPFGPVQTRMVTRGDQRFLHCAKLGCTWFMDCTRWPLDVALEEAVTHRCCGVWRGFERYTIAPERGKGRRT